MTIVQYFARNIIIMAVIGMVAACGFRPMYSTTTAQKDDTIPQLAAIKVAPGVTRPGQEFVTRLKELLNPRSEKVPYRYALDIKVIKIDSPAIIQQNAQITRYKSTLTVEYVLKDMTTGKIIKKDSLNRSSGYDAVESKYATFISEHDIANRLARELAQDMKYTLFSLLSYQSKPHEL